MYFTKTVYSNVKFTINCILLNKNYEYYSFALFFFFTYIPPTYYKKKLKM